jgi:hypothetical protein
MCDAGDTDLLTNSGRAFAERGAIDCLLVARLYLDLRRVASAACPVV